MPAAGRLSFSAAVGMIVGVHYNTAYMGTNPLPSGRSGLSVDDIHMISVPNFTDGGGAFFEYHTRFTGRQLDGNVITFLRDHDGLRSGGTYQLSSLSEFQFYVVDCHS